MQGKKGYLKGQSTIEYLMTYGFAFFIILLVLALLFGLVLPALTPPEVCQFSQPGFSCSQKAHSIFADPGDGTIKTALQLDNQQGRGITIISVACVLTNPGNVQRAFVESNGAGVSPPSLRSGASVEVLASCIGEDGQPAELEEGSNFQGAFALVYKYDNDLAQAPSRLAVATLSGPIQQG